SAGTEVGNRLPLLLYRQRLRPPTVMKLLLIHTDFIEYETKKPAAKFAEELPGNHKKDRMEEALAVFVAVEKVDEAQPALAVEQAVAEIKNVAGQIKTNRVMIYPYAHLSRDLSSPPAGKQVLADLETALKDGFEVKRSPFGWYKSFTLTCKGHPLSELSREIIPGQASKKSHSVADAGKSATVVISETAPAAAQQEITSTALIKESGLRSEWCVLTPDGELVPADQFDYTGHPDLEKFYRYESAKVRAPPAEPPHVKLMRELELVDYEPGSDSGNFRWYPKGQLIKRLLETQVSDICAKNGALRVETPIMYDINHPALRKYLDKFPARQYQIPSDDRVFFLRFAACFGQYLIMKDMTISYKQLPLRVYELTHYSFRREQRGELTGIKRLRAFTMPDMHTLAADMGQAKEEFQRQFALCQGWMRDLGLPYEAGVRIVREFFEQNRDFYVQLAKKMGRPILLELWKDRFFYFVTKFEFNVIDAFDKAAALCTVQIDVENAERFGIQFTGADGQRHHPLILHASISGSIDRNLYILLEREWLKSQKGEKPMLPFWLSPTQVRVIPLTDAFDAEALRLKEELGRLVGHAIRVDVDDRTEGVSRKIRDAEVDWVPIIVVVGEKEKAGVLQPRFRRADLCTQGGVADAKKEFSLAELAHLCQELSRDRPKAPLALPDRVTLRPVFRG
ncbi:MAG TPA: threonine--tRNA ligase, partial [Thermoplasmata archaeon]|nr:threonine--tRNA ligase [Thermoplasmata archaeon]